MHDDQFDLTVEIMRLSMINGWEAITFLFFVNINYFAFW